MQMEHLRKGKNGNVDDQYFAVPQPKFLESGFENQKQLLVEFKYQVFHPLRISVTYLNQKGAIRPALQPHRPENEIRIGLSYGI